MNVFFSENVSKKDNYLSEEESKHCTQVLRKQKGDEIVVYDGNGGVYHGILTVTTKKFCEFDVISSERKNQRKFKLKLAIAPTKSMDRMEWLVEKLSEIGVSEISFIQTRHSERTKIRMDRLMKKAISAMKQSGNAFLPKLNKPNTFENFIKSCNEKTKLIAHVDQTHQYILDATEPKTDVAILIGPEGDFSDDEVIYAKNSGFQPVSLGQNTLRTETAGLVACCLINAINKV